MHYKIKIKSTKIDIGKQYYGDKKSQMPHALLVKQQTLSYAYYEKL